MRFDRGVDPEAVASAAARASALIAGWSGGTVLAGTVDVGELPARRSVAVRPGRASMLLGVDLAPVEVREALGRLRIPAVEEDDRIVAEVPSHRPDLTLEVDLVEEVGRATGYDRVPSSLPGIRQAGGLTLEQRLRRRITDLLVAAGLWETQAYPFVSAEDLAAFTTPDRSPVRMANPISADDAFLAPSLLPGLLRAARRNVAHRRTSVRLFASGQTFAGRDGAPEEEERVAVLLTGPAGEEWPAERRELAFLDAKGVLEHLLDGLGVTWSFGAPLEDPWHAGRSAAVMVSGQTAGELGEVHPSVGGRFDLPGRVAAFELLVRPLTGAAATAPTYREVSRFPPVHRDVAFLVDRDVPTGAVRASLVDAAGDLLDRVVLFDVFEGDPLPPGKRSLAYSIDLRALDRTLTDDEADRAVRGIADRIAADFGGELRAG
jgi:phenylalanyl-tRNA synthetase beta chain